MELTVANDFQNNLDQATINNFMSHLADTLSGTEYLLKARNKNNTAYSESSKVFNMFGTLSCVMTIMNIQTVIKTI